VATVKAEFWLLNLTYEIYRDSPRYGSGDHQTTKTGSPNRLIRTLFLPGPTRRPEARASL